MYDEIERAVQSVQGLPGLEDVRVHEDSIVIFVREGKAAIAPIVRALDEASIPVQEMALKRPTLDDVFLRMTAITGDKKDFEYVPAKVPFYPPSKTWGVIAEPIPTMQKPLPPEKSVKHYTTPENFEMKLFASDADFQGGKPMAMPRKPATRLRPRYVLA